MNNKGNQSNEQLVVNTVFHGVLTSKCCTKLIAEIIKYILYHKQQLPYTFERLRYVISKKRDFQEQKSAKNTVFTNVDRLFKIAEDGLTTLEELFEKTKQEILQKPKVIEVALVFGSSPLTPKQIYHIHLPDSYCNDTKESNPFKKCQLQLLQSIVQSDQLNEMLMKPMNPTNMYVFIRKERNESEVNHIHFGFLPKNRFKIPSSGQHFHIKLLQSSPANVPHACETFSIYSDDSTETSTSCSTPVPEILLTSPINVSEADSDWYQACEVFKGFKDIYINGVSVSKLWTR